MAALISRNVESRSGSRAFIAAFKASLEQGVPPDELDGALQALWHLAKGYWEGAHQLAQSQDDTRGAWVHAHVHRVEGDLGNAGYWYRRAGRAPSDQTLPTEWDEIAQARL